MMRENSQDVTIDETKDLLLRSSIQGNLTLVKMLIESGVHIESRDEEGTSSSYLNTYIYV